MKVKIGNRAFNWIFAITTLLTVIIFYSRIFLTTSILVIISLIGLFKWKSKLTWALFFSGGIFGTIAEMVAINYGVWFYAFPNFMNVPVWLFIVWGNTAAFIYQTSIEFKKGGIKK